MKKLPLFLIILLTINTVSAATIHGTIYDLDLDKVNDVIVKIDTIPEQTYVAKNGEYSFNVPIGDYEIIAKYFNSYTYYAKEEIIVKEDGDYIIDLFLFPSFEEENELIEDIDISVDGDYFEKKSYGIQIIGIIFILIIISFIIYFYKKRIKIKKSEIKEKKEIKSEDYYNKVYELIKKEKRTTQKDIRKQIPLSEAKISLIITQLEHEKKIQKIKKGRGNVIIFKQ